MAGMIGGVRIVQIRQGPNAGQKMARFQLEDLEGSLPVKCFSRTYQKVKDLLAEDAIVFATGRVDSASEERALLLDGLELAETVVRTEIGALVVQLAASRVETALLESIATVIERHRGRQRLILEVDEGDARWRVRTSPDFAVEVSDELVDELANVVGAENLTFTRS